MPAHVKLTAIAGPLSGCEFVFGERTTSIVGRAADCEPQIVEAGSQLTSRHHCLFDINPPDMRVRDLGSLNGTFVNGIEIGRRRPDQTPEEGARLQFRERDLCDGDEVTLGETVLRVAIVVPATCKPRKPQPPRCTVCGRDVSGEIDRPGGELVCDGCRREPSKIVLGLLRQASAGDGDLVAIRGYEIVRELGRGGQGVVYLARHEGSGELIALKLLLAEVAVQESARKNFLREIETARALRHPNVVEFRESGSSGATFYFTCEYCDAGSVDRLMVGRGGKLPLDEALTIVLQALDGLAYAHTLEVPSVLPAGGAGGHTSGFVHRDIKPSNILLSGSGGARLTKVGDFGLSKAFDQAGLSGLTRTGSVGGTVAFMARQHGEPQKGLYGADLELGCLRQHPGPRRAKVRSPGLERQMARNARSGWSRHEPRPNRSACRSTR